MQDALNIFYHILSKALDTIFSIYFFNGVSLGMLFVSAFIFTVLLRYVIAIPRLRPGGGSRSNEVSEKKSN